MFKQRFLVHEALSLDLSERGFVDSHRFVHPLNPFFFIRHDCFVLAFIFCLGSFPPISLWESGMHDLYFRIVEPHRIHLTLRYTGRVSFTQWHCLLNVEMHFSSFRRNLHDPVPSNRYLCWLLSLCSICLCTVIVSKLILYTTMLIINSRDTMVYENESHRKLLLPFKDVSALTVEVKPLTDLSNNSLSLRPIN